MRLMISLMNMIRGPILSASNEIDDLSTCMDLLRLAGNCQASIVDERNQHCPSPNSSLLQHKKILMRQALNKLSNDKSKNQNVAFIFLSASIKILNERVYKVRTHIRIQLVCKH